MELPIEFAIRREDQTPSMLCVSTQPAHCLLRFVVSSAGFVIKQCVSSI
jgi:hypothetical protein